MFPAARVSERIPFVLSKTRLAFVAWMALASFAIFYQERTRTGGFLPFTALIFVAAAVIGTVALPLLQWSSWRDLARATVSLWMSAAGAAVFTLMGITTVLYLWSPASYITFRIVRLLLSPFLSNMVVQPNALRLGSQQFSVIIQGRCSWVEGMALILIVGCMWLVLFQEELRFPQAFVLLPLGAIALFLMNAVRLAALILIGNAGAADVAEDGFHSQAGWMAFILVAFGSSLAARRWPWVSRWTPPPSSQIRSHPATAFLLPFVILLAAGMISRATSSSFEWMYRSSRCKSMNVARAFGSTSSMSQST